MCGRIFVKTSAADLVRKFDQCPLRGRSEQRHVPRDYRMRRALLPIKGFFEWKAIIGAKGPNSLMPSP
jgi:hypothetical protein